VTVETAFADLPTIVVYRAPAVSAIVGRLVLRVKYASAVNLVLDRPVLPEFIQERCTPANLAAAVRTLMFDEAARVEQLAGIAEAKALLCAGDDVPSRNAARAILDEIERFPHGRRAAPEPKEG
jgi:lipid-A-disaccharide synthase